MTENSFTWRFHLSLARFRQQSQQFPAAKRHRWPCAASIAPVSWCRTGDAHSGVSPLSGDEQDKAGVDESNSSTKD